MRFALISFYSTYYEPVAPGLAAAKGRLHDQLEKVLAALGEVRSCRLVDSVATAEKVQRELVAHPPDLVIALPTVAVFAALLEAAVKTLKAPVLLLNLEESEHPFELAATRMSELIQHSHGLAIQAFSNVLMREGRSFAVVTARLDEVGFAEELRAQCAALLAPRGLRSHKLALFGHVFDGMRDVVLDTHQLKARLGLEVQPIPTTEVKKVFHAVSPKAVAKLDAELRSRFRVEEMAAEEWTRSLRLACAYRELCRTREIAGGALNSHGASGLDDPDIGIMAVLALSLLTEDGISLAEVGDLQTGVAMFFARQLGMHATYAELDFVDRKNDRWFIANSGELDLGMAHAQRPVWIRSNVNFKGRCGGGAAFDAALKPGAATLFSFTEGPDKSYRLVVAQGEVLSERSEVLKLVNGSFRPRGGSALDVYHDWCAGGAVHHAALSPGHVARPLQRLSDTLGIQCRIIS